MIPRLAKLIQDWRVLEGAEQGARAFTLVEEGQVGSAAALPERLRVLLNLLRSAPEGRDGGPEDEEAERVLTAELLGGSGTAPRGRWGEETRIPAAGSGTAPGWRT